MADTLYLSLWFPSFEEAQIFPRTLNILRQFQFSAQQPGISYVSVHPVSWNEATVFEERFRPGVSPEVAIGAIHEFLHDDFAYGFDTAWDLWAPEEAQASWSIQPRPVRIIAHGTEFDDGIAEHEGHIQFDFGLDTPFLYEDLKLTSETEQRVKSNIQKLVELTSAIEKNAGVSARVLWSESEQNLAQKLINRLQRVQ
jgi:hypothetical protein